MAQVRAPDLQGSAGDGRTVQGVHAEPEKADTVKEGIRDLSANEELFNEHFKALRARVESFFAYLDRHKFLHYCMRSPKTIAKMWILMWNLECLKEKRNPGDLYASDLIKANAITERFF